MESKPGRVIVIRESLVDITGSTNEAKILNQFLYWTKNTYSFAEQIKEEKKRLEREGDTEKRIDIDVEELKAGWIYKSIDNLYDELLGDISQDTIAKCIKNLISKGFLFRRRNPRLKWDRTYQYRVDLVKISESLQEKGWTIEEFKIPTFNKKQTCISEKSEFNSGKVGVQNQDFPEAIPEINNIDYIKENNTYIVENEENLTEKEKIKNLSSLSENTPSVEASKKTETSKSKFLKENQNKNIIEEVISYLNERTQKHFTSKNKQTIKFINGRLSEGYTIEDFKKVIDNRCEKWLNDEKMNEYLRPSTLFRPSNFEAYYNDVLSMKEKAISEKEQEFIEKFSIGLTPPNLTPKQALKVFKEENKINILGENDFKNLEEWYKMKIKDWNKKFTEKIKKESEVKIDERTKNQTNERAERYLRNFDKPRKLL